MAEPRAFSKNWVSGDDAFTFVSGSSGQSNLYDRDKDTKWQSQGSSDGVTETIDITTKEGTTAIDRRVTCLMLLNHNLKTWYLERYDGGAWTLVTSQAADTTSNRIVTGLDVTDGRYRLRATHVQADTGTEKYIGELVLCESEVEFSEDFTDYEEENEEEGEAFKLANGRTVKPVVRASNYRQDLFACTWKIDYAPQALRDSLFALKQEGRPFLFQPESTEAPERVFLVIWDSPWKQRYTTPYKGSGFTLEGRFVEAA